MGRSILGWGDVSRRVKGLIFLSVLLSGAILMLYLSCLPDQLFMDPACTVIEDRNGELLGARIAEDGQWRFPATGDVPDKFARSLLAYEDRYFYIHRGVNPFSLLRALKQNLAAGEIVSGGSTLSMQVIRLSRRDRPRTVPEKIIEAFMASRLELSHNKDEVLALYASHAPFGGNVVGLEAASWRYFNRPPEHLSWSETAVLAVLPNAPSLIHPGRNRGALKQKRDFLLRKLCRMKVIDSLTLKLSLLEPLPEEPLPLPSLAPHLLTQVSLQSKGSRIRTTLQSEYQQKLNQVVENHHRILEGIQVHNLAGLIIEAESGEILAYTGNTQNPGFPEYSSDVDIITSPRSTGSILKPALFCMMLEHGEILPGTLFPDIPTHYSGYTPKNFNLSYDGAVPAKLALTRSLNIPAVRMLHAFGTERFHYLLQKLGMSSLIYPADHYGLSLILGGAEASLLEITGMYAGFSRILSHYLDHDGAYQPGMRMPHFRLSDSIAHHPAGKTNSSSDNYLLHAGAIWLTFESLLEVNRPSTEYGWKQFSSSSKIAWKTGTSFGFRDAWAIGTTKKYTVGIWAGNADGEGRPGLTGVNAAAPVLFDVFDFLPETEWFRPPYDELRQILVCRESGHRAGQYCDETDTVWVTESGLNTMPCPYHVLVHLDEDKQYRIHHDCDYQGAMHHESWFVLPPVQEWYYRRSHPEYRSLPPVHPGCPQGEELANMDLIYPKHTARIFIPVEMAGQKSKVIFEAAHRKPGTAIFWHLDDRYVGTTRHIHQLGISPDKGMHTLTLVDESGHSFSKSFEIINK